MKKANKVVLLYNSFSGGGMFPPHIDKVITRFQENGMYVFPCRISKEPGPVVDFLNSIDRETVCKVICCGGDGSVDICINALIQAGYDAPIAVFPTGTANDLGNHLKIPKSIDAMIDVALQDHQVPLDVGMINDKYFVNEASLGFIVDVSQKTEQKVKNVLGMAGYYLKGIEEIPKTKPFTVRIKCNGEEIIEDILFMLVMNGSTAGGFKNLAPKASTRDGVFDVVIFKDCLPMEFVSLALLVLRREHINSRNVKFFQTKEIEIHTDADVGTDVDGEKGPEFPLKIKILPGRFNVCVPIAIR